MRKSTLAPLLFSFLILQPPSPSLRPAQGPPHTTTSLAVTLDGFSGMRLCPEGRERQHSSFSFSSSASSHSAVLTLSPGWSLISLYWSCGFQLPHQQLPQGRRLPEEPEGRPLLHQHPLLWPALRFLSGRRSVKAHTHKNIHTNQRSFF